MNFLNVFRGIVTTAFGVILMGLAIWFWYQDYIEIWPGGAAMFAVGIVLLIMPDDLKGFFQKVGDGILAKFFPPKTPPPAQ